MISNNTPTIKKSEIEYYAMLSKTGVHHYSGSKPPCAVGGPETASAFKQAVVGPGLVDSNRLCGVKGHLLASTAADKYVLFCIARPVSVWPDLEKVLGTCR